MASIYVHVESMVNHVMCKTLENFLFSFFWLVYISGCLELLEAPSLDENEFYEIKL
jgi:hypothetical protein